MDVTVQNVLKICTDNSTIMVINCDDVFFSSYVSAFLFTSLPSCTTYLSPWASLWSAASITFLCGSASFFCILTHVKSHGFHYHAKGAAKRQFLFACFSCFGTFLWKVTSKETRVSLLQVHILQKEKGKATTSDTMDFWKLFDKQQKKIPWQLSFISQGSLS